MTPRPITLRGAGRRLRGTRGVALLITLAVMTILVATTLEYNRRARYSVISAAAARNRLTLTQMADAGVHIAMAVLAKDKADNETDTLLDDWANPLRLEEVLQELPFEEGSVALAITDETARIQVNALVSFPEGRQFNESQRTLWERFLKHAADRKERKLEMKDDQEPAAIINSLKDWMDSGDDDAITGLSGAESSYYEDRRPPYPCRNGPVIDLDELLLVKGITPELFYGDAEAAGIRRYLTVYGMSAGEGTGLTYSGRINVNTAELPVLYALFPEENEDIVETLDELRKDILTGKLKIDPNDPAWFKQLPGFSQIRLDPKLIAMASDLFRIEATAVRHDAATTVTSVVQRIQGSQTGKWTCKVLSWEVN
jgi:general secretion pathway protein K